MRSKAEIYHDLTGAHYMLERVEKGPVVVRLDTVIGSGMGRFDVTEAVRAMVSAHIKKLEEELKGTE
jgi:hypothetical protein